MEIQKDKLLTSVRQVTNSSCEENATLLYRFMSEFRHTPVFQFVIFVYFIFNSLNAIQVQNQNYTNKWHRFSINDTRCINNSTAS